MSIRIANLAAVTTAFLCLVSVRVEALPPTVDDTMAVGVAPAPAKNANPTSTMTTAETGLVSDSETPAPPPGFQPAVLTTVTAPASTQPGTVLYQTTPEVRNYTVQDAEAYEVRKVVETCAEATHTSGLLHNINDATNVGQVLGVGTMPDHLIKVDPLVPPPGCKAMVGKATYYNLPGNRTSNGDAFSAKELRAASNLFSDSKRGTAKTCLVVTNLSNGKVITVRDNDTGGGLARKPGYAAKPVLDLTSAAFRALGVSTAAGHMPIEVMYCPDNHDC